METDSDPTNAGLVKVDTFYFQLSDWIHAPRSCIRQASFDCDALCLRGMATGHPQLTQIQKADN